MLKSIMEQVLYNIGKDSIFDTKNTECIEQFQNFNIQKNVYICESGSYKYCIIGNSATIDIDVYIEAEYVDFQVYVLCMSRDKQKLDAQVDVHIKTSASQVNMYMLSLLSDNARCSMSGNIILGEGIKKSVGHLLEENLILGQNVSVKSVPRLDVHSHDIRASHGLKIHRLDQDKLFYMGAKGLSMGKSRNLIVNSYIDSILESFEGFSVEDLKKNILDSIV